MKTLRILIIGDSRVLPREWEGKKSYFEERLRMLLNEKHSNIQFKIKTLSEPNKLLRFLNNDYITIKDFSPDIILVNLNLCEFIPRYLPLKLFKTLEKYGKKNPIFVQKIRKFLAQNRRIIHRIFGKNTWNTKNGYIKDFNNLNKLLSTITDNIIFLSCLNTSENSEYLRPGFQKNIELFNNISRNITREYNLNFLDLNVILNKHKYDSISADGIHYTDYGDEVIINYIFNQYLETIIDMIAPQKPNYIQVELTNYCSLNCTMCGLKTSKREKGFMSESTLSEIVSQLVDWEIPMIRFTLWGEALMHPEFLKFVQIAKNNGLKVGFNTNGILLNEDWLKKIINYKIDQIIFSVDSFDDNEIYQKFRRGKGDINIVNKNILQLIELKEKEKTDFPNIYIQMIGTDINLSQHNKFMNFWRKQQVVSCRITHLYSMEPIRDYNKIIMKEYDYFNECRYPWTTMGVYFNGDVTACCRDVDGKLKLGNMLETPLDRLYESSFLNNMRKHLVKKNKLMMPKFCQNCYKYTLK